MGEALRIEQAASGGLPRRRQAQRDQITLRAVALNAVLSPDHAAPTVWAFVQSLDLAPLYARIKSVQGRAGAPAIDPAILVALWLWATIDGVGSAREIDRLCERDADAGASTRRKQAARQRAAAEREQRLAQALATMHTIEQARPAKQAARRRQDDGNDPTSAPPGPPPKPEAEPRVSTTDPQARVMKMADGGFRPAFNAQLAVDTATQLIAAVEVVDQGSDMNQMVPMHERIAQRYQRTPRHWLADGGFTKLAAIEHLSAAGTQPLVPAPTSRNPQIDPFAPKDTDSKSLARWRVTMASDQGKALYKLRAATVECANAQLRRRRLDRFNVRGLIKARAVLLWHALAHNLMRMRSLNIAFGT